MNTELLASEEREKEFQVKRYLRCWEIFSFKITAFTSDVINEFPQLGKHLFFLIKNKAIFLEVSSLNNTVLNFDYFFLKHRHIAGEILLARDAGTTGSQVY